MKEIAFIFSFIVFFMGAAISNPPLQIQSSGVAQTQRPKINFTGSTSCSDDSTNNATLCFTDAGTPPTLITSVFIDVGTTSIDDVTYSAEPGPNSSYTITAARMSIKTAGSGGTTNVVFRASSGASNCDCSFACNSAGATGYRVACSGSCTFAATSAMTYSFFSLGDCAVAPIITGNISVEGILQ